VDGEENARPSFLLAPGGALGELAAVADRTNPALCDDLAGYGRCLFKLLDVLWLNLW
jgi:hypothetical protein